MSAIQLIKPAGEPPRLACGPVDHSFDDPSMAIVRVGWVGLCRTDLAVASGAMPAPDGIILGHECSGIVERDPSGKHASGALVAVNPLLQSRAFLGLHTNGVLQSRLLIDPRQLVAASGVDPRIAAYVEPVAASMAAAKARIDTSQRGVIFNDNRISALTHGILVSMGYRVDWIQTPPDGSIVEVYDYAIETSFEDRLIELTLRALRPGGLLVVKSRQAAPRSINPAELVAKELTLQAVNYYDFDAAMAWLRQHSKIIEPLLGASYPIRRWQEAFNAARSGESLKTFIWMED